MTEIIKELKQWWKAMSDEQHRREVLKRQKQVQQEALRRVQVREFGGELFFSFDGIPLLHADDLTDKLGNVVRDARAHFSDYRMTQELR